MDICVVCEVCYMGHGYRHWGDRGRLAKLDVNCCSAIGHIVRTAWSLGCMMFVAMMLLCAMHACVARFTTVVEKCEMYEKLGASARTSGCEGVSR